MDKTRLYTFRKGWEAETLARFILTKFSFVAQPSTVSDDIGSDFFCTTFRTKNKPNLKGQPTYYLEPINSFAIQIKSNSKSFSIDHKYLEQLQLPFFVGVVDLHKGKLDIYSGEFVPAFLSGPKEHPVNLEIELTKSAVTSRQQSFTYQRKTEKGNLISVLKLPKILSITVEDSSFVKELDILSSKVEIMIEKCNIIQNHIASRKVHEYLFKFPDNILTYAGQTSFQHFRKNFFNRLAEVFYNLEWGYSATDSTGKHIIQNEFVMFEKLYKELLIHNRDNPYLERIKYYYERAKGVI